jgi:hypothetical protein
VNYGATHISFRSEMEERKDTFKEPAKKSELLDDAEMIIEASEDLEVAKTFDELGLREELLRGKYYHAHSMVE